MYIDRIEVIIGYKEKDPVLDILIRVSLFEVGWGVDARARASSHDDHVRSNKLFTFLQVLVKHQSRGDMNLPSFEIDRLSINKLTRGDNINDALLDVQLTDIGITMLARSG